MEIKTFLMMQAQHYMHVDILKIPVTFSLQELTRRFLCIMVLIERTLYNQFLIQDLLLLLQVVDLVMIVIILLWEIKMAQYFFIKDFVRAVQLVHLEIKLNAQCVLK